MLQYDIVKTMFTIEQLEVGVAIGLFEVRLAVYELVVFAKASPNSDLFLFGNLTETCFLHLTELGYHFFVHLEILGAVLPRVAERLASQTVEGEQLGHEE